MQVFENIARMVDRIDFPQREFFVPSSQVRVSVSGLQRGEKVSAFVQSATDGGASLLMGGKQVFAKTEVPLQAGQWLSLEVSDVQANTVILRLTQMPGALEPEHLPFAASSNEDTVRLAQNFFRLLSTDEKSFLFKPLSEFLSQLQQLPQDITPLLAHLQTETAAQNSSAGILAQSLTEFMNEIALHDETAQQILEKLSMFFTQYSDAQTRNVFLKTFLSFHLNPGSQKITAEQSLNNFLLGTQVSNSLAHLTQSPPYFFLIPVVIENALYPLKVYYFKEKQRRGKTPREKTHVVLFLDTPSLGTIKIHLCAALHKLSVVISSTLPKIKAFLAPHLNRLRDSLEHLGYTIDRLDVLVEKNLGDTFSVGSALRKQLSLKSVNVRA